MISKYSALFEEQEDSEEEIEEELEEQKSPQITPYISGWVTPKGEVINGREWGFDEHFDMLEEWGYKIPPLETEEDVEAAEIGIYPYYEEVIQKAIDDGWIRFAGSHTKRNWLKTTGPATVNFQIGSTPSDIQALKRVIREDLSPNVKEIFVESSRAWFQGTPEEFLEQGFR